MEIERKVTLQTVNYNNVEMLSPLIREKLYVYRCLLYTSDAADE